MTVPSAYGAHNYGSVTPLTDDQLLDEVRARSDRLPAIAALARPCPHCGTLPGHPCHTPTGRPATTHTARRR